LTIFKLQKEVIHKVLENHDVIMLAETRDGGDVDYFFSAESHGHILSQQVKKYPQVRAVTQ
jgi:hypothetical protein